jgi:hypothetical protein
VDSHTQLNLWEPNRETFHASGYQVIEKSMELSGTPISFIGGTFLD